MEQLTAMDNSRHSPKDDPRFPHVRTWQEWIILGGLGVALVACFSVWLIAIRTPLWLDETVSYWQVSGGFGQIWARQGLSFPAYSYLLWIAKSLFGTSEIALRLPSVLAMAAAAYVLYRVAREFFPTDISLIVTIAFSTHEAVIFAAIDARPYAFGVLVVNCAILCLLRWMRTQKTSYAIGLGITSGVIFYFHYLLGVILAAFVLVLLAGWRGTRWRSFWPQFTKALIAFAIVILPVLPRLAYMFQSRGTHVFSAPPTLDDLFSTVAPTAVLYLFGSLALIAAAQQKTSTPTDEPPIAGITCLLLAFVPLGILYGTSVITPLHVFVERYRLVAISGIALCWGLLLSRINSPLIRLTFCILVVALSAQAHFAAPKHDYSWRDAIQAANLNTRGGKVPILVCSDLPESDYEPLAADAIQSSFYAPFSYYKTNSPLVPLPRRLNREAKLQIMTFLATPAPTRQRFLAMGFGPSWETLRWLTLITSDAYISRPLGVFDGVAVIEYVPR